MVVSRELKKSFSRRDLPLSKSQIRNLEISGLENCQSVPPYFVSEPQAIVGTE